MVFWRRKKARPMAAASDASDAPTGSAKLAADLPPPLLLVLKSVQEMDRKPPVTLTLIGVMYLLHIQATRTPSLLMPFALCPGNTVANWDIAAVLISPLLHVDDWYLYQSMLSFLWKGYHLEGRLGSTAFLVLVVYLVLLSQGLIVIGAHLLSQNAVRGCFMGFSGVLTALKVILNNNSPTFTQLYNFKVPTKYAAWLELFITYLLVPKLPLLAQAAGLIAGYIYIATPSLQKSIDLSAHLIQQLLVQLGLSSRRSKWRQLWPQFIEMIKRKNQRRGFRK